ncbi:hypothetical protein LCGC14_0669210 [marine sediment metagenome]|uniref:Uncharacterized protein n=1 Tax=marine sediment metagenome TaxID=412755 RepID=A0A0F9TZL4_9ZZZZ
MSNMLDKIKETGVDVDFIMSLPSVTVSVLVILFVMVIGVLSNNWIEFATCLSVVIGWMLGVFFGFKILLIKIEEIDKDEG